MIFVGIEVLECLNFTIDNPCEGLGAVYIRNWSSDSLYPRKRVHMLIKPPSMLCVHVSIQCGAFRLQFTHLDVNIVISLLCGIHVSENGQAMHTQNPPNQWFITQPYPSAVYVLPQERQCIAMS